MLAVKLGVASTATHANCVCTACVLLCAGPYKRGSVTSALWAIHPWLFAAHPPGGAHSESGVPPTS